MPEGKDRVIQSTIRIFTIPLFMLPVILDVSRYQKEQPTGVEVYANELVPRLFSRAIKEHVPILAIASEKKALPHEVKFIRVLPRRLWTLVGVTWALFTRKIKGSALFVPSHILPLFLPLRSYITIHDVAYRYFPESYSIFQRLLLEFSTWFAVTFATGIIAVSKQTAEDLQRFYKCKKEKLHVVLSGFDAQKFRESFVYNGTTVRERFKLEQQRYFVFIGRVEEKKNAALLVRSFLKANLPSDIKLVLIGKPGVGYELVEKECESDIANRVIMTGYLENDDAYSLLQDALAFVFPSQFEGFGFPVLEAYALSVPVICSSNGALAEVAGDAALFANTEKELMEAMEYASQLNFDRGAYYTRGHKQLERFSWEQCADSIWKLLRGR